MAGGDAKWFDLATVFPAGLDTNTDPAKLQDGMTPDAWNQELHRPGVLRLQEQPQGVGSSYVSRQYTIGENVWTEFYRRLWRINGNMLEYLAPEYRDVEMYQDIGRIIFDEDDDPIVTFFPCLGDSLFVGKATGGYIIPNASSLGGNFQHGHILPAMHVNSSTNSAPHQQIAYVSNEMGIYATDGNSVTWLTENLTHAIEHFQSRDLNVEYDHLHLVGSGGAQDSIFVYDQKDKKFFLYKNPTDSFRFTTRTLVDAKTRPFTVHKIALYFNNTTGDDANIEFQVIHDDGNWKDQEVFSLQSTEIGRVRREKPLAQPLASRRFALRLLSLPANIEITRIQVLAENFATEEGWSQ